MTTLKIFITTSQFSRGTATIQFQAMAVQNTIRFSEVTITIISMLKIAQARLKAAKTRIDFLLPAIRISFTEMTEMTKFLSRVAATFSVAAQAMT